MPRQDGVGRHQRRHFLQGTTADGFAFNGEPSALVICQAEPSLAYLLFEGSILLAEVLDDGLLVPVDSAGQRGEQHLPGLKDLCH
jgi:hypothetical protein